VSRAPRTLAPYLVALLVPSTILGVLYVFEGRSPLWGLVGGAIGLLGAMLATATRIFTENRDEPPERG
jgi:hypothetical protein